MVYSASLEAFPLHYPVLRVPPLSVYPPSTDLTAQRQSTAVPPRSSPRYVETCVVAEAASDRTEGE